MIGIEKSTLNSKKKGPTPKLQFLKMHLAVYPFEVIFLNNVDYQTTFYFQKNFQVIGQIQQSIPPCQKDSKYQLNDVINIVNFRLFSPKNVVYKWSVYRKCDTGEEEYLDTCTLNLREAVNSFVLPQNNLASHSNSSLISLGFIEKDMGLKFPRIGVILMFKLFVAGDPKIIRDYVHHRVINKQDYILESIPTPTVLNRSDSGSFNKAQPSKMYQKSLVQIDQDKKKNIELNHKKVVSQKQPSKIKSKIVEDKKGEDAADYLEHLIMSFDVNAAPVSTNTKSGQLHQESNNFKKSDEQDKLDDDIAPNLAASIQLLNRTSQGNVRFMNINPLEKRTSQAIDFGVLKLESDQGRINQEAIDKKLQLQQLQEIEEERTSKGELQTNSFRPNNTKINKQKTVQKKSHVSSKTDQKSQVSNVSNKIKKIVFIVILSILLFIVTATLSRNIHKKAHGKSKTYKAK